MSATVLLLRAGPFALRWRITWGFTTVQTVASRSALDAVRLAYLMLAEQRPQLRQLLQDESNDYWAARAHVLSRAALTFLETLDQAEKLLPDIERIDGA